MRGTGRGSSWWGQFVISPTTIMPVCRKGGIHVYTAANTASCFTCPKLRSPFYLSQLEQFFSLSLYLGDNSSTIFALLAYAHLVTL